MCDCATELELVSQPAFITMSQKYKMSTKWMLNQCIDL